MFHIIVILLVVLSSIKWGTWSRWREFLPTIYYFAFFNMFYQYISFSIKPVWELKNFFVNMFLTDTIYTMIAYPALVVLFLSHFPQDKRSIIFYYVKYIGISIIIEWLASKFHSIEYFEGWNLKWTILFYSIMYPLLQLHHRKPAHAIVLSLFIVAFYFFSFDYHVH
ncbi:CBO0543 family protein [Rossellomorea aquimaris]|uniref:CBO0543 family protein n=1 Tax=Rossellomorea aquimaris TaxID=189382 RepID=UPI0007D06E07|nr:CBO0543 family protein [Rossellomorea aquimaris]